MLQYTQGAAWGGPCCSKLAFKEIHMFTIDAVVDAIQTGKKTMVNTFVQNVVVKDSLIQFVDAQAEYTKKAARVGMDTMTTLTQEAVKATQEAMKFDYAKFGEGVMKAYQTTTAKK